MSRFRLILLLVASHALAFAAAWFYLDRFSPRPKTAPAGVPSARDALASPAFRANVPTPPPQIITITKTNAFHWSQVESGDYRRYISNLRAIGCPEQTIKDFIITDIMKHYALRRGQLKDNGRPFRYWETSEKRALTARQLAEREAELAKIDKEVPAVLRELLGVNYERELGHYFLDTREDERRLGFLSENKRGQVFVVRELVEEMRESLMDQIVDGRPTPVQAEKLKAINELHAGLLAQSLNPAELEQYELSTSETAERLRTQLTGFNPSEEEFRLMFKLWRDYDGKYAFAGPESFAQKEAEQLQIETQIKEKLGEVRAAEYERSRNPAYRDLILFTQSHELPGATAQAIYEMRSAALDVRAQLVGNKQLKADQRNAALHALQDEVENSLRRTLGDQLYGRFARDAGSWVSTLGTVR